MLQLLVIFVAPSDCSESVQTTGRIRVHMEGDDVEQCRAVKQPEVGKAPANPEERRRGATVNWEQRGR